MTRPHRLDAEGRVWHLGTVEVHNARAWEDTVAGLAEGDVAICRMDVQLFVQIKRGQTLPDPDRIVRLIMQAIVQGGDRL